jgi:hypothetical protein
MKTYGGVKINLHAFSASTLRRREAVIFMFGPLYL